VIGRTSVDAYHIYRQAVGVERRVTYIIERRLDRCNEIRDILGPGPGPWTWTWILDLDTDTHRTPSIH